MTLLRLALASWMVVALGCAGSASRLRKPSEGPPWREYASPHFRVLTQAEESEARAAAEYLEAFRRGLAVIYPGVRLSTRPIEVLYFPDGEDYELLLRDRSLGQFIHRGFRRTIVLKPALWDESGAIAETLAHELVHSFNHQAFSTLPLWLNEGIATDLSKLEIAQGGRELTVGRAPSWAKSYGVDTRYLWSLEELWKWADGYPPSGPKRSKFYESSWAWVIFLRNRHPGPWADFQRHLTDGRAGPAAFDAAFAQVGAARLHGELKAYFDGGKNQVSTYSLPPLVMEFRSVRLLSAADVHVLRARLLLTQQNEGEDETRHRRALALLELGRALEADPHHLEARELQLQLAPALWKGELAQRLVTARPDSGHAWRAYAEHATFPPPKHWSSERCATRTYLREALRLAPDEPQVLTDLSWELIAHGQWLEAGEYGTRVVALAPWDPAGYVFKAYAAKAQSHCDEALAQFDQALRMIGESETGEGSVAAYYREERRKTVESCVPAPAPDAPAANSVEEPQPPSAGPESTLRP